MTQRNVISAIEQPTKRGRPKGSVNKRSLIAKALSEREGEVAKEVVRLALDGDTQALKMCIDRLMPPLKSVTPPVEFDIPAHGSLADKAAAIIDAVAVGQLPADIGCQLISAIGSMVRITEVVDLEQRVKELEAVSESA